MRQVEGDVTVYLTTQQAAEVLSVHPETVCRALRAGEIPGAKKIGSLWRIPRYAVLPPQEAQA